MGSSVPNFHCLTSIIECVKNLEQISTQISSVRRIQGVGLEYSHSTAHALHAPKNAFVSLFLRSSLLVHLRLWKYGSLEVKE